MNTRPALRLLAALAALSTAATASAQVLLTQNFDALTVGAFPSVFGNAFQANIGPATPGGALASGDVGAVVVGSSNTLGTGGTALAFSGNALRIYDSNTGTTAPNNNLTARANTASFTASSTGLTLIAFDFSTTQYSAANGNGYLRIGFGTGTVNASASGDTNTQGRVEIARNNTAVTTISATNGTTLPAATAIDGNTTNLEFPLVTFSTLRIVANTSATALDYNTGSVSGSLAARSYDVYLGTTLLNSGGDLLLRSGTAGITQLSFATGGSQSGSDWVLDNLSVTQLTAVPEPSAFAAFTGLAALGLAASRRRRRA